jgi:hypothetical protein
VNVGGLLGVLEDDCLRAEACDAEADEKASGKADERVTPGYVFCGDGLREDKREESQGGHDAVEPNGLNDGAGGFSEPMRCAMAVF